MTRHPWHDYAEFLEARFPGCKMQKISINAGFSCPNRDGTIGRGGCTYCNNQTFNPSYCQPRLTIAEQLHKGIRFFARKYPVMRYLAYFQAYTNTHDSDIDRLVSLYEEALSVNGVDGIIIGTRPDCVPDILLDRLSDISSSGHFVMIEYGAESSHESTLLTINRCHTWADTADAVERTRQRGLPAGLHLIMGLPGETRDMMLSTVDAVNSLMPDTVKFHQLQVIRGTKLASDLQNGIYSIANFTDPQTYLDLCCEIVSRLHPDIAIERFTSQSPKELLLAPLWGIKNHEFADSLDRMLRNKGISQGNTLRQKN